MRVKPWIGILAPPLLAGLSASSFAAPVYLNYLNTTVTVGANTTPGSWNNTITAGGYASLDDALIKVIDAPSADATEVHSQPSHIWYTTQSGGGLELNFTFDTEYDISTLHFWNYNGGDSYDVDWIDFAFYNASNLLQGTYSINPLPPGNSGAIEAQDFVLAAPLNVQYVTAFLGTTNGEIDFQNIGFTAEVSVPVDPDPDPTPVPAPGTFFLLAMSLIGLLVRTRGAGRAG
ncbi:MAG: PEP-CTERM sorting domain-containing protein [Spongiibacteraceae bacterium]|jgi:hypothetical protein|nr:PEP-CTERM sorting domain-containing protein [Spongiibacteraceae bacterium]